MADAPVTRFVAVRWSVPRENVRVEITPLNGGLESTVARAAVVASPRGVVPRRLVVKKLRGAHRREREVYRALWRNWRSPPIAKLLGVRSSGATQYLFLEYIQPSSDWPWSEFGMAAATCRALARLHDTALPERSEAFDWDYESELARSAEETLEVARGVRRETGERLWRRLGDLAYTVRALPEVRARLREAGMTIVHGDVHPGNVIAKRTGDGCEVVLIDWARARIGSPLEDVACWLHSLGCWDPEARRRHDSLLRAYLRSRAEPSIVTPKLKRDYWLASLSNGLSGAIRFHLAVAGDPARHEAERSRSLRALRAWHRVVRQAVRLLKSSPAR